MKRITAVVAIALATAWTSGCGDSNDPIDPIDPGQRSFDDTFEWRGHVAQGDQIHVMGIVGNITASSTEGSEVVVTATKVGQSSQVRRVAIKVQSHAGGVTICAVYPDVWGTLPDQCGTGNPGPWSVRDYQVEVTFTVQVPAGVEFAGGTVVGDVVASDLHGDAFVNTVQGDARVVTEGLATATTVTGSVDVSIGRTDWDRDLVFSAVSGDVTVEIDPNASGRVEARVTTGSVQSDFPLDQVAPGILRGVIGRGGSALTLSSVSGNVTLRRRR